MTQPTDTREAARQRTISEYRQGKTRGDYFAGDDEGALRVGFASGYDHGFDAGAASVDRAEIVRDFVTEFKENLGGLKHPVNVELILDKTFAAMEEGK